MMGRQAPTQGRCKERYIVESFQKRYGNGITQNPKILSFSAKIYPLFDVFSLKENRT